MAAKRSTPKIDGVNVVIGGRRFVAPPIPLGAMRLFPDVFGGNGGATPFEMADIILMTLQRNYPDLTQEDMDSMLDARNMAEVFAAMGEASGLGSRVADDGVSEKK